MSIRTSPLLSVINSCVVRFRESTRQVYIETVVYINSFAPEFILNTTRVNEIDTMLAANSEAYNTWPSNLTITYGRNDITYIINLATYKGTPVDIHVDAQYIWLKFPSVNMTGRKLDTWTARNWKRSQLAEGNYYRRAQDPAKLWEISAFIANRVPTQEEFMNGSDTGNWHWNTTKVEANAFLLDVSQDANIAEQIEKAHNKYLNSVKKAKTFEITSRENVYKTYLRLRGKILFEAHKVAQAAKTTEVKAVNTDVEHTMNKKGHVVGPMYINSMSPRAG